MSIQHQKVNGNTVLEFNPETGYSQIIYIDRMLELAETCEARLLQIEALKQDYPYIDYEPEILGLNSHIEKYNMLKAL